MTRDDILSGDVLDEITLSLDELARACAIEPQWIVERIEAGVLCGSLEGEPSCWTFVSADLARVRQLVAIERDFDANPELAALVVDLIDEVRALRAQLKAAGLQA
ncbi:MAG: chaperone modulator CbpM [Azoarcus sp.]|nr:chaperone modulator CbpM [Azoarcus sp.]